MHALVQIIILSIICIQILFFVKNLMRMKQFSNIFIQSSSWRLRYNISSKFADGVYGEGNSIFESIIDSINKYLGNNSGSVIEFSLLKDAVDRHCDSVENDIATQTPIPLYWGLAGTMAGVILGLWDLLDSDAIITLMGSGAGEIDSSARDAAEGIDALLSGVAWAMVASIVGILLTTINSILFKNCKLKEENGKNSFLAWMQSELLPELPSDTSKALNKLVVNLNAFNQTFANNTTNLGRALAEVNESYKIQAEVIKAVHDMDVMKMATVNVRVLQELNACTDKLEVFNQYLSEINGYTNAIHRFEVLFNHESQRLRVLEEIRDFFTRNKSEIAMATADADRTLQDALQSIKDSADENVKEMHNSFVAQAQQFKEILQKEKESFEEYLAQLNAQFSAQMTHMPQMAKQLEEIAAIPTRLDKLIDKIEKSNSRLAVDVANALKHAPHSNSPQEYYHHEDTHTHHNTIPEWMQWVGLTSLVIIAAGCIFNIVIFFFPQK